MSRAATSRLVEAFFRRWPLYLLLVVASVAIGVWQVGRSPDQYVANGTMSVDADSLVTMQSGVKVGVDFGYLTAAQFTTQELYGIIVTDVFMESAADSAGLELSGVPAERESQLHALRLSLSIWPTSGNIVQINATTDDPQLSADLLKGVMDEFIQYKIGVDIAESSASIEFFTELSETYRQEFEAARADVDDAIRRFSNVDEMTLQDQLRIDRLQNTEELAKNRYEEALADLELAGLAELQTDTDIGQSYTVIDVPEVPTGPVGRTLSDVTTLMMFAMVGVIAALVVPLATALMKQDLQFPDDIEAGLGYNVTAVVPAVRKRRLDLKRAPFSDPSTDAESPSSDHWANSAGDVPLRLFEVDGTEDHGSNGTTNGAPLVASSISGRNGGESPIDGEQSTQTGRRSDRPKMRTE